MKNILIFGVNGYLGGLAASALYLDGWQVDGVGTTKKVDEKLHSIMVSIHEQCAKYGKDGDHIDYVKGANIAGFVKVADAMLDQGVV